MLSLVLVLAVFVLGSIAVTVYALRRAEDGYEDEAGYHAGTLHAVNVFERAPTPPSRTGTRRQLERLTISQ